MKEPDVAVSHALLKLIADIDAFKGKWEVFQNMSPERLRRLRKIATVESIGSSTRIEGAKLTDLQVETLLSNLSATSFTTRDEQEVAGYAEAMDLVFQAYDDLSITENHIRQLHKTLLRHSTRDARHRGDYKKLSNHVVAVDGKGKEIGVIFETASPFDTPREMQELVEWTRKTVTETSLHPLLLVAVFTVVFLAIHPFQDGNGRLSRILTTLLLLRAGYGYVPYASLESIIEDNKDLYYKALRRTQKSLKSKKPDWEPWLDFFLRCLKKQKDKLALKIENEKPDDGDNSLPDLSLQALKLLARHPRLTLAQMAASTGANKSTLKLHLRTLVLSQRVTRHGKARATWYSLPDY